MYVCTVGDLVTLFQKYAGGGAVWLACTLPHEGYEVNFYPLKIEIKGLQHHYSFLFATCHHLPSIYSLYDTIVQINSKPQRATTEQRPVPLQRIVQRRSFSTREDSNKPVLRSLILLVPCLDTIHQNSSVIAIDHSSSTLFG